MLHILFLSDSAGIQIDYIPSANDPQVSEVRWINKVTFDPWEDPDKDGSHSYIDPPIGGWVYAPNADNSIYYWDNDSCENCENRYKVNKYRKTDRFTFIDLPSDPRLDKNKAISFRTCLVDTTKGDEELACVEWDLTKPKGRDKIVLKNTEAKTVAISHERQVAVNDKKPVAIKRRSISISTRLKIYCIGVLIGVVGTYALTK